MPNLRVQIDPDSPAAATYQRCWQEGYAAAVALVEEGGLFACPGVPIAKDTGAEYGPGFMEAQRNLGRWIMRMNRKEKEQCPLNGLAVGEGHLHGWWKAMEDIIQKTEGPKFR